MPDTRSITHIKLLNRLYRVLGADQGERLRPQYEVVKHYRVGELSLQQARSRHHVVCHQVSVQVLKPVAESIPAMHYQKGDMLKRKF